MFLLGAVLVIVALFLLGRGEKNDRETDAAPLHNAQSAFSAAVRPRIHHVHVPPTAMPSASTDADGAP
jgi:hypothetical protein